MNDNNNKNDFRDNYKYCELKLLMYYAEPWLHVKYNSEIISNHFSVLFHM